MGETKYFYRVVTPTDFLAEHDFSRVEDAETTLADLRANNRKIGWWADFENQCYVVRVTETTERI